MFGKKQSDILGNIKKATHNILKANALLVEQIQDALTEDETRILDYFWNRRTQKLRRRVMLGLMRYDHTICFSRGIRYCSTFDAISYVNAA